MLRLENIKRIEHVRLKPMIQTILVQQTMRASPDGVHIEEYQEGYSYGMPEKLATIFLTQGWGVVAERKMGAQAAENKMMEQAENKETSRTIPRMPKRKGKAT